MKKIILIFSFMGVIFVLINSCSTREYETFRSYINTYYDFDEFVLTLSESKNICVTGNGFIHLADWQSTGYLKKLYDDLCTLHNDLNYNKKRDYLKGSPDWGWSYKGTFSYINVFSNKDFDEDHPAGSSLNDIVRFLSISPKIFIDSNYKNFYDWDKNYPENFNIEKSIRDFFNVPEAEGDLLCYHPIDKMLSEITVSDLALVGWFIIVFEKQPDMEKEHEITVTIKESDGRVFTPNITMVFE